MHGSASYQYPTTSAILLANTWSSESKGRKADIVVVGTHATEDGG